MPADGTMGDAPRHSQSCTTIGVGSENIILAPSSEQRPSCGHAFRPRNALGGGCARRRQAHKPTKFGALRPILIEISIDCSYVARSLSIFNSSAQLLTRSLQPRMKGRVISAAVLACVSSSPRYGLPSTWCSPWLAPRGSDLRTSGHRAPMGDQRVRSQYAR
ncbi:hypothetical protein BV20DRAFT_772576 [Pilatotrama ljubarskyi]|nr:hypothetical protein BV20DRAFT_772576 [Pilatotrama ljubarskyi]